MATVIQIKRSSATTAPTTLQQGELAYTYGSGIQGNGGDRLYIGTGAVDSNGNASSIDIIGGKYFADLTDHVHGTLTASSAVLVDSNKAIDEFIIGNSTTTGGTIKFNEGTNNGSNFVALKAADTLAGNTTYTLPTAYGENGQFLKTDASGILSWDTVNQFINLAGDTGTDRYNTAETLTFTGGQSITTEVDDNEITFSVTAQSIDTGQLTNAGDTNAKIATPQVLLGAQTLTLGAAATTDISGLTSLTVDNITINGNTVQTDNANGDLTLSPNGTGTVVVPSGYELRAGFTADSLVNKQYVDAIAEGLHVHASVQAATTQTLAIESGDTVTYDNGSSGVGATLTLSTGISTLDGYTLVDGDRILIKDESNTSHNGIYIRTSSTVLTRATDFDTSAEIQGGDFFFVTLGTLNGSNGYVQTEISISVGSTAIIFEQFSGAGQIVAGDGLAKSGNELSVNVDDSTIEINADTLRVKDAGITNVKLAKSTITVVGDDSTGTAVSLGETFKIAGGESLNASVSVDTLTVNLDDNITVNQIGAKDSSAVSITSPLQTSTIQSSGNIVVNGGTVSAGSGSTFGDLTLADGSITDASGTIDFDNENLTLTGNITTTGGTVSATQFTAGTLTITDGQITDSDGTIGFNDINLDSIDQLTTSSIVTNVISSSSSTAVVINDALNVDGNLDVGSTFTISNGSVGITAILDEDTMSSDSATALATQQSIKAYVDTQISASTVAELNDIGDVDAVSGNKLDGDILLVNDDSSNVFTLSSQLTTGLRVPSGTTAQRPTIYAGIVRYNSETGKYEGSTDGSSWNAFAMEGSVETLNKDVFTGDASSLTFTFVNVADPIANSGNGELGLIVYIDNVLQEPTQNYTVTPTAITFDSAPHQDARIVVIQGFDGGAGGGTAGGLTTVTNTDVDSAVENLDTFNASSYRAAHYQYVIENDDTAEYQTGQLSIIHDGSTAQVQEYAMLKTGSNDLITFSVDIDSGNVRLRGSAQAPNSKFRAKRILLEVQ